MSLLAAYAVGKKADYLNTQSQCCNEKTGQKSFGIFLIFSKAKESEKKKRYLSTLCVIRDLFASSADSVA
ncbi:MAG: hypothetical protein K2Z81_16625 [Cyanobacteria bacterium]|nr:hypothetical protein [Cyanobacteriota bacterium]